MTFQAWPFLVSRNQALDYQTIVAPDFIDQAKLRGLLTKATEGDLTPPGQAMVRGIEHFAIGKFSIVFRIMVTRAKDIGQSGYSTVKDSFGREIYRIEGLVLRQSPTFLVDRLEQEHLEQVHAVLKEDYRRFWYGDTTTVSPCLAWQETGRSSIVELEELEALIISAKKNQRPSSKLVKVPFNPTAKTIAVIVLCLMIGLTLGGVALVVQSLNHGLGVSKTPAERSTDCAYLYEEKDVPITRSSELLTQLQALQRDHEQSIIFLKRSATQGAAKTSPQPQFQLIQAAIEQLNHEQKLNDQQKQKIDTSKSSFSSEQSLTAIVIQSQAEGANQECLQKLSQLIEIDTLSN